VPSDAYLPGRGDLAWINFEPQIGREQSKNRPGLVLTEQKFNRLTGLLIACPVTRTDRPYGSRVPLAGTSTQGFVMVEQVKSIDWRARGAAFIETVPQSLLEQVKLVLGAILDIPSSRPSD
jgi:mRNA interferase MazF